VNIVFKKVLLTALIAIVGSIVALYGGGIMSPLSIVGLIIVALSPIISFIIIYYYVRRLPLKKSPNKT